MKKTIFFTTVCTILSFGSIAQNVGIGTTTPDPSAQLEIVSPNKGVLIPRMNSAAMTGIPSPAQGLLLYNSERGALFFYEGGWHQIGLKADALWTLNGANIYNNNPGFVGVGISDPKTLLHVFRGTGAGGVLPFGSTATFENSSDTWLSLLSPDNRNSGLIFGLNSNNFSGGIFYNSGFNPKGLEFRVRAGVTTMVIDSFGFVGIGNLDPKSPVHVKANGGAGGVLPFFSTAAFENGGNTFLSLLSPNANESGVIFGLNDNNISGSIVYNNLFTQKGFQFRTQNNVLQMVIDSFGRVGIGDPTPTALKLDVKSTLNGSVASFNGGSSMWVSFYENDIYRGYIGSFSGAAADMDLGTGSGNTTGKLNLTIQGTPEFAIAADGTAQVLGFNVLEFGAGVAGKEINAGKIGYNAFGKNALTFVGAGTNNTNRAVYFYSEGGTGFDGNLFVEDPSTGFRRVDIKRSETGADGGEILLYNAAGAVTIELDADFGDGDGRVITRELQITGGSDLAEHFSVNKNDKEDARPGMLVSIDEKNEGKLVITDKAMDKKVVGVISGANGIKPGMLMGQQGTLADGEYPVALSGRVYVLANNEGGEIQPGDFLTSSSQKGYARKVTDIKKSQGAIIGKAMGKTDSKTGYVLVLVNLQ